MGRTKLPAGAIGEISVFKVEQAGKVRYRATARWRDPADGKRKEINRIRDTKGAARAAVRDGLGDRVKVKEDQVVTVKELLDQFLHNLSESALAPRTQQTYRYSASYIADHSIAKLGAKGVTVAKVKEFLADIVDKHGTGAAKHARAVLRHCMELAVESETIAANPVAQLKSKTKRKSTDEKSKRGLTDDELQEFLGKLYADPEALPMGNKRHEDGQANGKDVADLVNFLFSTGMRVGEATALRWRDVDLDAQVVHCLGTVSFIAGQGVSRQDHPKSYKSIRTVPIAPQTAGMLENRMRRMHPVDPDAPVFGSPQKPLTFRDPGNLNKIIRKLFDRYGIDWGRSHLGRRYRVTSLAERGVPTHKIADLVGHASVATTWRYLGRSKDVDQMVRDAL